MEWVNRLEASLNYIEEHLTTEIDSKKLAQIAQCSFYHYQRIFSYMVGIPLAEYIRRRKISVAATELQQQQKVIDVALKYGYDSSTSFTRAFKKLQGITPSDAQKAGAVLKTYPPIKFSITIRGDVEMEYRIEKKEAFKIIGRKKAVSANIEENFQTIPQFWNEVAMDGTVEKLAGLMKETPRGLLGVGEYTDEKNPFYFVGVASEADKNPDFETHEIAEYTWAIFPGEGEMPHAMQNLTENIVTTWLPSSGYEYANGPDIEVYIEPNPQNAKFEVWIPIVESSTN